jgi:hypothetical protein
LGSSFSRFNRIDDDYYTNGIYSNKYESEENQNWSGKNESERYFPDENEHQRFSRDASDWFEDDDEEEEDFRIPFRSIETPSTTLYMVSVLREMASTLNGVGRLKQFV